MKYKLTVYDNDGSITYEFDKAEKIIEKLENLKLFEIEEEKREKEAKKTHTARLSPYERTRNAVYATGNRWAIENFNATH